MGRCDGPPNLFPAAAAGKHAMTLGSARLGRTRWQNVEPMTRWDGPGRAMCGGHVTADVTRAHLTNSAPPPPPPPPPPPSHCDALSRSPSCPFSSRLAPRPAFLFQNVIKCIRTCSTLDNMDWFADRRQYLQYMFCHFYCRVPYEI